MDAARREQQIALLSELVTPRRLERMHTVLASRTRYLTVVVEDIYQSHNASAVLRSCDSFGIQDVHVVEESNEWQTNPAVELGTAQWLTVQHHSDISKCVEELRSGGYRIVATTPHGATTALPSFDVTAGPAALLFGTEIDGLSTTALAAADEYLEIPMVGFVESLNISVSAAIILYTLTTELHRLDLPWHLDESTSLEILFRWLHGSVKHADAHLERAGLHT